MIPVSALVGDNVILKSMAMQWYHGPTLMAHLETVPVGETRDPTSRSACRCNGSTAPTRAFRGFCGTIAAGTIRKGDAVKVMPSGRTSRVARIVTFDGDLDNADRRPVDHRHARR